MIGLNTLLRVTHAALLFYSLSVFADNAWTPETTHQVLPDGSHVTTSYKLRKNTLAPYTKTVTITHGKISVHYKQTSWDFEPEDGVEMYDLTISLAGKSLKIDRDSYPIFDCLHEIAASCIQWIGVDYLMLPENISGGDAHDKGYHALYSIKGDRIKFLGQVNEYNGDFFGSREIISNPYNETSYGVWMPIGLKVKNGQLAVDSLATAKLNTENIKIYEKDITDFLKNLQNLHSLADADTGSKDCRPKYTYFNQYKYLDLSHKHDGSYCEAMLDVLDRAFMLASIYQFLGNTPEVSNLVDRLRLSALIDKEHLTFFSEALARQKAGKEKRSLHNNN